VTTATHRFGACELDEARRAFTAHGREVKLQPRVFDLLCYLVLHRERVVSKDELLDALWPGTVVVDNALQRVVSLARAALVDAGLPEAVRTYPRHGYRFCLDDECAPGEFHGTAAAAPIDAPLVAARAALECMDWVAACDAFAAAEAQGALPAEAVEEWGRAAICAGLGPSVVGALERRVAERDAAGDSLGAARATLLLVQIRIDLRQGAMANGLLQRASRWLDGRSTSVERGHYAWMASRIALSSGQADDALALADEACRLGRTLRDQDVECLGLAYRGHALLAHGQMVEGLAQHDEAAAVIRLGSVQPWVAGWVLCSIIYAARYRYDWQRAAQFCEAFVEWSRASRMPAFPGTCQLHRAAVLGVQGELERAATEVRAAAELLARAAPWAEGDAHCVLGDVQLSMGDFDAAEASFRQAHSLGWDPQPGLARVHLLTGRPELALRGLERALEEGDWSLRERRGQLLCLLVHAAVAVGNVERARDALRTLSSDPQMLANRALTALHFGAEADVAMAGHDFALAAGKLRQAVHHWREVGSPVGEAEARLRLAECLLAGQDVVGTELELHALESKLAAAAAPHRDRLRRLKQAVQQLTGTPATAATDRETILRPPPAPDRQSAVDPG
jgi:DNA-binding winged helix-turn-helix (wHTH) protein